MKDIVNVTKKMKCACETVESILGEEETSLQAKDTNSTSFITCPWQLASLKMETPAASAIEYHESHNLC